MHFLIVLFTFVLFFRLQFVIFRNITSFTWKSMQIKDDKKFICKLCYDIVFRRIVNKI